MVTNRVPLTRRRRDELDGAMVQELWLGPDPNTGSLFHDREALQEAWERHGHRIVRLFAGEGRRPAIWWEFSGLKYPGYDLERSTLYEAGLLEPEERDELLSYWRAEYDKAQAPDFSLTLSPGKILYGAAARKAHYAWCDLPKGLLREWTHMG